MTNKRSYNLGRRAETAAETRQLLVEATAALHAERGISATSLRDIAERAGVSVGTAYHHFPTYLDAVKACGAHTMAISPLPPESIFDGIDDVDERVHRFVRELCAWYDRYPWLERIRAERSSYPPVEEGMSDLERGIEQLARMAAQCTADEARTVAALADVAVYSSLRRAGMPAARIPRRIAEAIVAWLGSHSRSVRKRRSR
ncbi:MAG TPA: helix-turn-helix domain-containing protein [Thermoanaerobaculia bacterium]|nr:helix-turn-helix domain-containing protein [Thermoanaerobaculia bacterium]